MSWEQQETLQATCVCGMVTFKTTAKPILSAKCYCKSCRDAGRGFEQLSNAPRVVDDDGGTEYMLVRKDRVLCSAGSDQLLEYRLDPASATRRVLATCCNSPMFLDFSKAHWLTLYRNRFASGAEPVQMRVMTGDREEGVNLANDMPNYPGHSIKFMLKLLPAWLAMGFRIPTVPFGRPK
jgi:hypothetical protein